MDKLLSEIQERVGRRVREGYDSFEEIVDFLTESIEDEHEGAHVRSLVERATVEAFDRHRVEQATWTAPTDCDRLDRAFKVLNESGIVARQNFTCCQNCGHGEIMDEVREASQSMEVRGYVFFHMQDTEGAAEAGLLYLAFGAPESEQAVGWEVVEALRNEGLTVDWEGDVNTRILVKDLDWRRHRDFTGWSGMVPREASQ